jgi:hypothetical protein
VVRSNRDSRQLADAIRSKLLNLDPGLPSFIQTWSEEMNGAWFASRMATLSLGVLGLMGAILSITGIFGMAAYSVSRRLKELGIRMALGAQRTEVLLAALGRALRLLAIGSTAGLGLGILAQRAFWHPSCTRPRLAFRLSWPVWSWQWRCWDLWPPGFRRNARYRSIRWSCCAKSDPRPSNS